MSKNKKKKPKLSTAPQKKMPITDVSGSNRQLVISYEHLDNSKKYTMDIIKDNRLRIQKEDNFRQKIKEYCTHKNFKQKITEDKTYRENNHIHPIDWKDNRIRENNFSSIDSDLMEQIIYDCWQLGIDNQGFRIHGFFIENVFYVVWLDPDHNLYERK